MRFIPRNTSITTRESQILWMPTTQISVLLQVYQGGRSLTKDSNLLSQFELSAVLHFLHWPHGARCRGIVCWSWSAMQTHWGTQLVRWSTGRSRRSWGQILHEDKKTTIPFIPLIGLEEHGPVAGVGEVGCGPRCDHLNVVFWRRHSEPRWGSHDEGSSLLNTSLASMSTVTLMYLN